MCFFCLFFVLRQTFLSNFTEAETWSWIGLIDKDTEGTWMWVDGSPLTLRLGFNVFLLGCLLLYVRCVKSSLTFYIMW